MACLTCTGITFVAGFVVMIVLYYVYAIMGLIETSHREVREICYTSNILIYVIVSLIIAPITSNAFKVRSADDSGEDRPYITEYFCLISQGVAFIIWKAIEVFNFPCVNRELRKTVLYKVALSIWIWNIIDTVLVLCILAGVIVVEIHKARPPAVVAEPIPQETAAPTTTQVDNV